MMIWMGRKAYLHWGQCIFNLSSLRVEHRRIQTYPGRRRRARMADDSSTSDIVVSLQADEQHHGSLHQNHMNESRLRTVDW